MDHEVHTISYNTRKLGRCLVFSKYFCKMLRSGLGKIQGKYQTLPSWRNWLRLVALRDPSRQSTKSKQIRVIENIQLTINSTRNKAILLKTVSRERNQGFMWITLLTHVDVYLVCIINISVYQRLSTFTNATTISAQKNDFYYHHTRANISVSETQQRLLANILATSTLLTVRVSSPANTLPSRSELFSYENNTQN